MWRIACNAKFVNDQCPERWYEDKENLCGWLCRFVTETRKADGGEYTPRNLHLLLAGLQQRIRESNSTESLNIFTDARFKEIRNVCDSIFKRLHQKGTGSETKSTPVLTQQEEAKLWESGVLNLNTPIVELCDTIDTTRYRDTKWYRSTPSFGIVGIDYAV